MKDHKDPGTVDLFAPAPKKRGPKPSGKALSNAERQRRFRARTVVVKREILEAALLNLTGSK